ncbi:translation elongation factor-like protein [Candidatus Pacearchaeota archaeon]|jgi:putative protease|nr:translation elongation factor-like protein [Candidatus Pacearchaeota archaeon]|tara:strand:+ start:484 stop:756 length:273 start_codon:yes stop_codon:yes gene_type:complete
MAKEKEESLGKEVGEVSDYFSHVEVAALKVSGKISVGDKIRIKGHTTDFEQTIDSMQIDRKDVESVKKGDDVGIKVSDRVRKHDKVYLVK